MHLLITRPIEDAKPLAQALDKQGHKTSIESLMEIRELKTTNLKLSGIQAILITSANGIRALAKMYKDKNILICTVGDASAIAAHKLGFTNVRSASGNVEALIKMVKKELSPTDGPLVHIAGSYRTGDLAKTLRSAGFVTRRKILYDAKAVKNFSTKTNIALKKNDIDGVLFFSPRTASIFCQIVKNSNLLDNCQPIKAFCLSKAVSTAAALVPWAKIIVAEKPNSKALLFSIKKNS